jgi:16S rRNA processing protein RimM
MSTTEVVVGTAGRAHGLQGEMFVHLRTDSPELRFTPGSRLLCGDLPVTVASYRGQDHRGIIRFDEVSDRTSAEALTGSTLLAEVEDTETTEADGEYFDHQLVGLEVVTESGEVVGSMTRVDHLGFQDQLVVSTPGGERPIPFVDALVPEVDLAAGRVTIHVIPGLLEDL